MQKISVVLPVKNGEMYVAESIDSILSQSYADFELLIFDDDSTDHTIEILHNYKDPRIKIFTGNDGFIANLNKGIEISKGKYIARMDADDIMNPIRLESQLELMENSNVDVCGSWMILFGEGINPQTFRIFAGRMEDPDSLKLLSINNCIFHPTVMMRREFLIKNNLRYTNSPYTEDYRLWYEIAKLKGVFHCLPETLLAYRVSNEQMTKLHIDVILEESAKIRNEIAAYLELYP